MADEVPEWVLRDPRFVQRMAEAQASGRPLGMGMREGGVRQEFVYNPRPFVPGATDQPLPPEPWDPRAEELPMGRSLALDDAGMTLPPGDPGTNLSDQDRSLSYEQMLADRLRYGAPLHSQMMPAMNEDGGMPPPPSYSPEDMMPVREYEEQLLADKQYQDYQDWVRRENQKQDVASSADPRSDSTRAFQSDMAWGVTPAPRMDPPQMPLPPTDDELLAHLASVSGRDVLGPLPK